MNENWSRDQLADEIVGRQTVELLSSDELRAVAPNAPESWFDIAELTGRAAARRAEAMWGAAMPANFRGSANNWQTTAPTSSRAGSTGATSLLRRSCSPTSSN
ncbi:hypothetical protein ACXYTP_14380 [Tsukamurella ocularis]|uniref:hypothetical protein n=1 Tax=Tsukamurella ocularis TaxID=1970234 RepID=UPI0039EF7737